MAPYREHVSVGVAWVFPWYLLAALGAREGLACVLGQALAMKAIHDGKAHIDRIDAQKIAVLLRGAMRPLASVSPAAIRGERRGCLWAMAQAGPVVTYDQDGS